jgi:hypothetical protein
MVDVRRLPPSESANVDRVSGAYGAGTEQMRRLSKA